MYNEHIEGLIKAALADGELTEKEKQILFKKAEAMGIDLDEFEMVLDARLVELKKEEARQTQQQQLEQEKAKIAAQPAAPKSEKYGDVRKCPACGAIVPSFKAVCPDCGHEFTGIEANSSVEKLSKMLLTAEKEDDQSEIAKFMSAYTGNMGGKVAKRKAEIITNFPIPTTKEDLLEFITFLAPKAKKIGFFDKFSWEKVGGSYESLRLNTTYRAKLEEVLMKGKITLSRDAEAMAVIESVAKQCKIKI